MLPSRHLAGKLPLLLLCALACQARQALHSLPEQLVAPASNKPSLGPEELDLRELPDRWSSLDLLSFEASYKRLCIEAPLRWSGLGLADLRAALTAADHTSVRAALLLTLDQSQAATDCLLERLSSRSKAPTRDRCAGDLIAAAACATRELTPADRQRLFALVEGGAAHPELEVRVECARALATWRERAVLPFLFRVLRVDTPAESLDPPDWPGVSTLFWAKFRASECLAHWAGQELEFRPDASYVDQAARAAELALALDYQPRARR